MRFEYYHEPATIGECLELLMHYGPEGLILAGGTDLVPRLRSRSIKCKALICLDFLKELSEVQKKPDGGIEIGATRTLTEVMNSELLADGMDVVQQGAMHVSSMHVRNVATLGGNSCNASPGADTVPGLIAAKAVARILEDGDEKQVPLEKFFVAPGKTILKPGSLLAGFQIPPPLPNSGGCYKKYAIRGDTDLAIVGVAAQVALNETGMIEEARVVLGAVAPTPLRAMEAEQCLIGAFPGKEAASEAAERAAQECSPISDQRATAGYRRKMVNVWTRYALSEAFNKALKRFEDHQKNGN